MSNLAKCPFCGSGLTESSTERGDNTKECAIVCGDCGTRGPLGDTENEAADLWNRHDGIPGEQRW